MNKVLVNGTSYSVDGYTINGEDIVLDSVKLDEKFSHILHNGKSYTVEIMDIEKLTKTVTLKVNTAIYTVQIKDRFDQLMEQMGFDTSAEQAVKELKAPMPGLVLDIRVKLGDVLKKGDAILVLEAMKMENVLKAQTDVIIKSVEVEKGKSVEKNQVLVVFE